MSVIPECRENKARVCGDLASRGEFKGAWTTQQETVLLEKVMGRGADTYSGKPSRKCTRYMFEENDGLTEI